MTLALPFRPRLHGPGWTRPPTWGQGHFGWDLSVPRGSDHLAGQLNHNVTLRWSTYSRFPYTLPSHVTKGTP